MLDRTSALPHFVLWAVIGSSYGPSLAPASRERGYPHKYSSPRI